MRDGVAALAHETSRLFHFICLMYIHAPDIGAVESQGHSLEVSLCFCQLKVGIDSYRHTVWCHELPTM